MRSEPWTARARFLARSSRASLRQTYNTDAASIASDAEQRERNANLLPFEIFAGDAARPHVAVQRSQRARSEPTSTDDTAVSGSSAPTPGGKNERVSLLAGWSNVRFRPGTLGNNAIRPSHYFNSSTNLRFQQNRYGLIHQLNWDVKTQSLLQHRIASYYNAQCCGFSAEYQFIDLSRSLHRPPSPQDSRFHFSVTLGGIGNVSNIFGALGGTNER